jgi:hypothetical protein
LDDESGSTAPRRREANTAASPQSAIEDYRTEQVSNSGTQKQPTNLSANAIAKASKHIWTSAEQKEVMWCFYYAVIINMAAAKTRGAYQIWRERNPSVFPEIFFFAQLLKNIPLSLS